MQGSATSGRGNADVGISLIVVSDLDIASTVQVEALIERGGWNCIGEVEGDERWQHRSERAEIWWMPRRLLFEDQIDMRYESATGCRVREVLFLSRHFAASGRPSLTLHPIGVPGEGPRGTMAEFGGERGRVVPPSPRFSTLFLALHEAADRHDLTPEFEITVETTHHGPILDAPSLFIEIGSTDSHWGRQDAAEAWADVLIEGLGLDGGESLGDWHSLTQEERSRTPVMIGIGGGHYAPRHSDVVRRTGCWMGHLLAGYALPMERPEDEGWDPMTGPLPAGAWRHSIDVAIDSTRESFPGGQIVAHLDRKSFKGWQRQAVRRHLEERDIRIVRTADLMG